VFVTLALSMDGGHPPPIVYVLVLMGYVGVVVMPLIACASFIGIIKSIRSEPRHGYWKSLVSLVVSLLIITYLIIMFINI